MRNDTQPTLPVRTGLKAGGIGTSPSRGDNHNQALMVCTGAKAGGRPEARDSVRGSQLLVGGRA